MYKKLAYAVVLVGAGATALAVGCGGGTKQQPVDFSLAGDMAGGGGDMNVMKTYIAATPHDIDTNAIGGMFSQGTAVKLSGMIVTSPITGFAAEDANKTPKADCVFEVFVQDPTCTTPPCGLLLESAKITNPGGTGTFCDFSYAAMSTLKGITQGDKVDASGSVDTFPSTGMANDMSPSGTVDQHSVVVDSFTTDASGQALPAPMVITDTSPSLFVPFSGTGWAMYEGMIVTLQPASGKFTTTLDSFGGWYCAPGGAHFADTFTSFFRTDGEAANMYPPNGSMFSGITGIVDLTFGGGILPDSPSDFIP